jgi:Na+-transporting methylmalonyl-CoA/oxaloacetate decarboxylase gamma subunit
MDVGIDVAGFSIGFVATFLVFLAIFLIGFFKNEKRSLGEPKETKRP